MPTRPALDRDRIVDAAVRVADRGGLGQVTMRNVGEELGVEAMSLYHHVANKQDLLDELADRVFTDIELPSLSDPWRPAMRARAASARATLASHPWALGLIESRSTPGPALLRHHDRVLGCLRTSGFSVALAAHAFAAIDAYVYGFVLTELNLPFDPGQDAETFVAGLEPVLPADRYPHLVELVADQVVGADDVFGDGFVDGLELILEGLERRLAAEVATDGPPR